MQVFFPQILSLSCRTSQFTIKLGAITYLTLSMMGLRKGFRFAHTVETSVAKICPTSAITDRVNGIPTMANRMQNARPRVVTGAM